MIIHRFSYYFPAFNSPQPLLHLKRFIFLRPSLADPLVTYFFALGQHLSLSQSWKGSFVSQGILGPCEFPNPRQQDQNQGLFHGPHSPPPAHAMFHLFSSLLSCPLCTFSWDAWTLPCYLAITFHMKLVQVNSKWKDSSAASKRENTARNICKSRFWGNAMKLLQI